MELLTTNGYMRKHPYHACLLHEDSSKIEKKTQNLRYGSINEQLHIFGFFTKIEFFSVNRSHA